jgi:putative addiction module component (TIGR02574 family)
MTISLAEILELSVAERIQLVEDIWDSIAASPTQLPLTDEQRDELDRRLEEYEQSPDEGVTWEALKSELLMQP